MYRHHGPFRHGNLLSLPISKWSNSSAAYGRGSIEATYMADVVVRLDTFAVVKDRERALTSVSHEALERLREAVEQGLRVLVLT